MKKFEQVKKVINGTEYVAQFNGFGNRYRAIDSTYIDGTQVTSMEKMAIYLLENVLVTPKKSIDDFEDGQELDELISFLSSVNNGNLPKEVEQKGDNSKGKE